MGIFQDALGYHTPVQCPIWPNFELVRDVIVVPILARKKKIRLKNEGARVFTILYINFSDAQGYVNSVAGGGIWPKFELIQAFMHVLVTCKNEDT